MTLFIELVTAAVDLFIAGLITVAVYAMWRRHRTERRSARDVDREFDAIIAHLKADAQ